MPYDEVDHMHWKDLAAKSFDYARGTCRYPRHMVGRTARLEAVRVLSMPHNVLVIAAHPDDETIGAAILIHRLIALGYQIDVVFATNGRGAYWRIPKNLQKERAATRLEEAAAALKCLDVDPNHIYCLGFPDHGLHRYLSEAYHDIHTFMTKAEPHIVLTHAMEGGHRDHDTTSLLAHLAAQQLSIPVIEWASYNRDFPPAYQEIGFPEGQLNPHAKTLTLSPQERALKSTALSQYHSQPESHYVRRRQEAYRETARELWPRLLKEFGEDARVVSVLIAFNKMIARKSTPHPSTRQVMDSLPIEKRNHAKTIGDALGDSPSDRQKRPWGKFARHPPQIIRASQTDTPADAD